jgi:outer membrane lipoprotein-sorting protein
MTLLTAFASGCAASHTRVAKPGEVPAPAKTAAKQDLVTQYDRQAEAIKSLNAAVKMTLTAGSAYSGLIKQYHSVEGFILAQQPASIRVIGQAPVVGTNIFDMESDGETFAIFIPSQNKFITGPANLERPSAKPIENLRPQHLISAIFWEPIPAQDLVLFDEENEGAFRYYVLTVARPQATSQSTDATVSSAWETARRIWFDRADLSVARIETYDSGGKLGSDIKYGAWDAFGTVKYPRRISLARPGNDYQLQIEVTRLRANEAVASDRFVLPQPQGTELVRVGEDSKEAKP